MIETSRSTHIMSFVHWVDSDMQCNFTPLHSFALHVTSDNHYVAIDLDDLSVTVISEEYAKNLVRKYDKEKYDKFFKE